MCLAAKDRTVVLAFPLLLLPPLLLCCNVSSNGEDNDNDDGGSVAATKTPTATAVVWVVACPCFFVKFASRCAQKHLLPTAKWGLPERFFQDKPNHIYLK
jgi:hypothetical protein